MSIILFEIEVLDYLDLGKAQVDGESIEIKIPKYGSVTLAEFKKLGAANEQVDWARIGLSRVKPNLADADLSDMPLATIQKAYDFMVREVEQWKEPPPESEDEGKLPTGKESSLDSGITSQTTPSLAILETAPSI